jgi:hypothetical protein
MPTETFTYPDEHDMDHRTAAVLDDLVLAVGLLSKPLCSMEAALSLLLAHKRPPATRGELTLIQGGEGDDAA